METGLKNNTTKDRFTNGNISGRQYLTFHQGSEVYGIPIIEVREVIDYVKTREIPLVPGYINGVLNLRGSVLPVVDLSFRFYGRKTEIKKNTSIIVLDVQEDGEVVQVGLMIDAVNEVLFMPDNSIEERPDFGTKIKSEFISNVGKVGGKYIILLNVKHVVDIEELSKFEGLV